MTSSRRQRRVAELIKEEIGDLLGRRAHDPRLHWVTVTDVQVTPDLAIARVYYAVIGEEAEQEQARVGLEHARGYLRRELAARLQLRIVPQLEFLRDEALEYGRRIDALIDRIREEDAGDADA